MIEKKINFLDFLLIGLSHVLRNQTTINESSSSQLEKRSYAKI
jgi:hypothetical protein